MVDHNQVQKVLGNFAADWRKAHKKYAVETIPEKELKLIRDFIQLNQVTGGKALGNNLKAV